MMLHIYETNDWSAREPPTTHKITLKFNELCFYEIFVYKTYTNK